MRKRHTAEQIARALWQAEAGTPISEIIRTSASTRTRLSLEEKIRRPRDSRDPRATPAVRRNRKTQEARRGP